MADLITTGTSDYGTGGIDSATVLVSNVSPISAKHPNGLASAIVQIETILGSGTNLKGTQANLVARLNVALAGTGTINLTGFNGLTTDRGLMAVSPTILQVMNHTPIGIMHEYAGSATPTNWLLCDGSAVSRSTYAKLFAVISTTYGVGDGSTTFNLPDRRGRVAIGIDGSANRVTSASFNGANADTLGGVGGEETHVNTLNETAPHDHTSTFNQSNAGGALLSTYGGNNSNQGGASQTSRVASAGGGAAHNNMQPWIAVNIIIFAGV